MRRSFPCGAAACIVAGLALELSSAIVCAEGKPAPTRADAAAPKPTIPYSLLVRRWRWRRRAVRDMSLLT